MTAYPSLTYIPLDQVIGAAGGDPWAIDGTLQSGDPGQISELATAFRDAAACTAETWQEFGRARDRFQASWNRENGAHPINDGAEVQRATTSLFIQAEQLPAIAVDLQRIAADLAEAQRMSDLKIDKLNSDLHFLDVVAGEALAHDEDTSAIAGRAVEETSATLSAIDGYRDAYVEKLQAALTDLRLEHGYDPAAIEDVDGDAELGHQQRAEAGTGHYDRGQRAKDEALVNSDGPMTAEKADAAARLRDFATAGDPSASPDARRLAGERLDDFAMANFVGPLPRDPVLGGDARTRAKMRLDLQHQFEAGYMGMAPMAADQATQALDDGDQFGRMVAVRQAYFAMTSAGMSEAGAKGVIGDLVSGTGLAAKGAEKGAGTITDGRHTRVTGLSPADAKVLEKFAGRVTKVTDVIHLATAFKDRWNGGSNEDFGGAIGEFTGGSTAAWATAIAAGSVTGPWTTAALTVAAMYFGSKAGNSIGSDIGASFDGPGVGTR